MVFGKTRQEESKGLTSTRFASASNRVRQDSAPYHAAELASFSRTTAFFTSHIPFKSILQTQQRSNYRASPPQIPPAHRTSRCTPAAPGSAAASCRSWTPLPSSRPLPGEQQRLPRRVGRSASRPASGEGHDIAQPMSPKTF
jgi:hypothetical protein